MNIKLGEPYEAAIKGIIEKGYAGSQTEVIRQAILPTSG
jgi:Arc/MetJ-type ribon-helix-helix transcriptional regulator